VQRKQAETAAAREASFQQLYSEVLGGLLGGGSGIMQEISEVLQHNEATQRAHQAELYQQWSNQVFEPIQARIHDAMGRTSVKQLEASLQAASDAYVAASSKRPCFLDHVDAEQYDPLHQLAATTICVPTGDLVDPLKRDLLKTQAEKALLTNAAAAAAAAAAGSGTSRSCGSGGSPRFGDSSCNKLAKATVRPTLEVQRWAAGQIHATPYGELRA
jgi:hypothetical protein